MLGVAGWCVSFVSLLPFLSELKGGSEREVVDIYEVMIKVFFRVL